MTPTPQQIRKEIEGGPLAADLALYWANVFAAEPEVPDVPKPDTPENPTDPDSVKAWAAWQARQRWERVAARAGKLTPDGAFDLFRVLLDPTRRSKPAPMRLSVFAQFLAGRGVLTKIVAGQQAANAAVANVCTMLVLLIQGAPDRTVDPADPVTAAMIDGIVLAGIASAEDKAAWLAACVAPCSRADELGWTGLSPDRIAAAKEVS